MLSRHLWPRDARTNALMVYYTGRQRGRLVEDAMGLWPWLLVFLLDAFVMLKGAKRFDEVWMYSLGQFPLLYFLGAFSGAALTTFHLRRIMDRIPLDELLITRLKPLDIVQGLSIRPIAVQSALILAHSAAAAALACVAAFRLDKGITISSGAFLLVLIPFRFYCIRYTIEMGGAIAMRANMCLRALLTAALRMSFDILMVLIVLLLLGGLLAAGLAWIVACFLPFPFLVPLVFCLAFGFVLSESLRNVASEAMDWCHQYPDEWWINNTAEAERAEFRERTLFTRWEPVRGRRRVFVPRALWREPPSPAPPDGH